MKRLIIWICLLNLGGCVGQGDWGSSVHWPTGGEFSSAARTAAADPAVWVPVLTAGLMLATDVDKKWSEDLAEDQPLFGDEAQKLSSTLRDISSGAYVLTAMLAPSPTWQDKFQGVSVGLATAALDGAVSYGLKEALGRERPDGSNDLSMPSGHASKAASRTHMARRNLTYIDMPDWSRQTLNVSLHAVAIGTGLARVEARKHHLADVLVGYAMGNFLAGFMHAAFFDAAGTGPQLSFQAVDEGGALTLTLPLR
ncbi:MAG: phosphatase PAP2 family protein [bacterium]